MGLFLLSVGNECQVTIDNKNTNISQYTGVKKKVPHVLTVGKS